MTAKGVREVWGEGLSKKEIGFMDMNNSGEIAVGWEYKGLNSNGKI